MIIGITIGITSLIVFVPVFSKFFLFESIGFKQILISVAVGFVSVFWIEIYKAFKRKKTLVESTK
jgi:Ca2+-transporting ATPase